MKTEQQMQNLRDALVWWQTVPEANVAPGLSKFSKDDNTATDCKTVACFGGWCARWPGLIAQGLKLSVDAVPYTDGGCRGIPTAEVFFGDRDLWQYRGSHPADRPFAGTDHALVTNRIRWALEH